MHPAFTQTGAKLASSAQFSPVFHIMSALKCTGFCFVLFYLDLERLGSCCCLSPSLFVQLIHMTAAADSCRAERRCPTPPPQARPWCSNLSRRCEICGSGGEPVNWNAARDVGSKCTCIPSAKKSKSAGLIFCHFYSCTLRPRCESYFCF